MEPVKIVIGADGRKGDLSATNLVKRLRFGEDHYDIEAVNVVAAPAFAWYGMGEMSSASLVQQLEEQAEEFGIETTDHISNAFSGAARRIRTVLRHGTPVNELMGHADDTKADLIAVGGATHKALGGFLTGSVGRGLVIGATQNLLIAKGEVASEGPIRAVLATDHSRYADRCIEALLALAPKGISHLTVMTAYPTELIEAIRPLVPDFALDPADWVQDNLCTRNQRVIDVLKPLGCTFDSRVVNEHANEAIKKVMAEANADLLILGAQGHNWVERLTLGSVSFQQVVAETYSTLVLRVSPEAVLKEKTA